MGNNCPNSTDNVNENKLNLDNEMKYDMVVNTLIKSKLKSKLKTKSKKHSQEKDKEEFIVKYNKSKNIVPYNINIDISDHRRIVWVSLIGLYQTWKYCPSHILYSSLLIIPLKRDWFYNPIKYQQQLQHSVLGQSSLFQTKQESLNEFIQLLKWKDSQGLVFWMENDYTKWNEKSTSSPMAPFWQFVSTKLINLYDPVTRCKYQSINGQIISTNIRENGSKFGVSIPSVFKELFSLTMEYKTIQEIIYQSNAKSLNPITSYSANNMNSVIKEPVSINENGEDDENWWISSDYDPFDIDDIDDNDDNNI